MRITPLDIQQKQFPMRWIRGFDVEEVYSFLEIVREEMEDLLRENASTKEKLRLAESQLLQYKAMEGTLKETISTAQQMAEVVVANARIEAEIEISEARVEAAKITELARQQAAAIRDEIVELKGIRRHFKEELKRLIEGTREMLDYDEIREGHNG